MYKQEKTDKPKIRGNEIDYVEAVKKLWEGKSTIIWGVCISILIGLLVAFTTPKQYKVVTTLLPQTEDGGGMGSISSLAAIAGFDIDLSDNGSEISPVIFPQILESEPFQLSLMHSKYSFKNIKEPVTLFAYVTKYEKLDFLGTVQKYTIGLPTLLKSTLKKKKVVAIETQSNDGLTHMNDDEYAISKMLKSNVTLSINKKEGYLTLTSIFGEALLTAQVARRAQELLQETITSYKTKRANEQLDFFEKRFNEKKQDYLAASKRLSSYKDRNLFISTASGNSEETRLTNDYNLAYSVYSELAKQLENARIKVKRVTPVYVIIKPIVVPQEPFAPRKTIILFVFVVLGFITSCGIIFGRYYISRMKAIRNI